jgi:hypothetical protein
MLHEFLARHRNGLIARCSAKVAKRTAPLAIAPDQQYGIPMFLDQLADAVTEFGRRRDSGMLNAASERAGNVSNEIRNILDATVLAFNRYAPSAFEWSPK